MLSSVVSGIYCIKHDGQLLTVFASLLHQSAYTWTDLVLSVGGVGHILAESSTQSFEKKLPHFSDLGIFSSDL